MSKLAIPHNAFVFVGDGRKALFLRNEGDEKFPNLVTERVFVDENPPTHEQGTESSFSIVLNSAHGCVRSILSTKLVISQWNAPGSAPIGSGRRSCKVCWRLSDGLTPVACSHFTPRGAPCCARAWRCHIY